MKFPADYLREAGYTKEAPSLSDPDSLWGSPEGESMSYDDARAKVFGTCACCGEPSAYPGAIRCGAACTAMHEAKDCRCYAQKGKLELVKG